MAMKIASVTRIILIIIATISASVHLQAQNLDRLDQDNGFRKFIIGRSLDDYKNDLQPLKQVNPLYKSFRYDGSDSSLRDVADVHPFEIHVLFDTTNALVMVAPSIFVVNDKKAFEKQTMLMFEDIKKWFIDLYGSNYSAVQTEFCEGLLWETEKLELSVKMCSDQQLAWRRIDIIIKKKELLKN